MVANAGIGQGAPLLQRFAFFDRVHSADESDLTLLAVTSELFDKILLTNTRSVMLCYKYAALQMVKQGRGGRLLGSYSSLCLTLGSTAVSSFNLCDLFI